MQSLFRSVVIGLVASGQISQAKTITTIITTDSIETATSTSTPMSESTVWTVHEAESEGTISSLHWASPHANGGKGTDGYRPATIIYTTTVESSEAISTTTIPLDPGSDDIQVNTITHSDVEVTITTTVSDDTSASEPTDSDSESDQDQSTEDEEPDDGKKSSSDSENAGEAEEGPRVLTVTSVQMEDDTGTAEAANQDVNYQSGASKRKGSFWIVFAGCAVTVTISVLWDIR